MRRSCRNKPSESKISRSNWRLVAPSKADRERAGPGERRCNLDRRLHLAGTTTIGALLGWLSHFFVQYVPAILLVPAAWILVGHWWRARKVKDKPRRLQFGLRSVLGMVAVFAAIIALLNAWFIAPYQAEQHAATALTQLGGKIVMVDSATTVARSYVGEDLLNMDMAAKST